jgi:catechol 2,3-dioxygenase-like lactoylglutathione lyase family enzyme
MTTVLALDHVQLAMPAGREDDARAFYGGLLELPERPKPPTMIPSGCWFEEGAVKIHLGVEPDFRPARKAHPALVVRDLAALTVRLRAAGFEVQGDAKASYPRAFTHDPFGNRIELLESP